MANVHDPSDVMKIKEALVSFAAPYIPKLQGMEPGAAARRMQMPEVELWDERDSMALQAQMGAKTTAGLAYWYKMGRCVIESEDGMRVELVFIVNLAPYRDGERNVALDTDMREFAFNRGGDKWDDRKPPVRYSIWFIADTPREHCTEEPLQYAIEPVNVEGEDSETRVMDSYDILFVYFDEAESKKENGTVQNLRRLLDKANAMFAGKEADEG